MWWFGRLAALAAMTLALALPRAAATEEAPLRGEMPLADLLEGIVTGREVVAFDARGGGQTAIPLRLKEKVLWTGTRGKVGVALTDQRVLAVATQSAAWQQASYRRTEIPPKDALLGDRVAVVVTSNRALGFSGGSGNLVEYQLGPHEAVLAVRAGESIAVVVTDRRALGLSPDSGGFFQARLNLHERIEKVTVRANLATVTTSRRILIFRGPTGSWEERNLDLR
jgi:hypothetical protein